MKELKMEQKAGDVAFKEGRRVLFMGSFIGVALMAMGIQAFRIDYDGLAITLLLCAAWLLAAAWINRSAGSKELMILKDDGIWFFNADGLLPYTSIDDMEIETYCNHKDFQFNSLFHITPEKVDTVPAFKYSRLDFFFKKPGATKGRGFRKHVVVFNYGGLRALDGKSVDPDDLYEELSYRIGRAYQAESAIVVPASASNDPIVGIVKRADN